VVISEPELPPLYHASVASDLGEVERLLKGGADPNDGESIFHAAEKNHRAVIDLLIQFRCDISGAHATYGNTPLFFLCGFGNDEDGRATWHQGVAYLLERGADPNVPSGESRETPLHRIATSPAGFATARLLLDRGADPTIRDAEDTAPYQLAMRSGNTRVAELLAERGGAVPLTPDDEFIAACRRGDETGARQYLQQDPLLRRWLSKEIGFAGTMLHWAAWNGQVAVVQTLIAVGADVNQRDREFGSSPLGWAAHGSEHCRTADNDYCAVVRLGPRARRHSTASMRRPRAWLLRAWRNA
jgi:ankyrin repeat protein